MREEAVLFGEKESLVGVLTDPVQESGTMRSVGAILLNPGILHRVGPGRIYVKMARELAALGFTALRFDFSGIGDSRVRHDNLPFDKSAIDEARSAMNFLETKRGIRQFIFLGGCSGARVSFAAAYFDARVLGGILINFPAAADDDGNLNPDLSKRKDGHYYLNFAIRDAESWRKFFTGKADYRKILGALAYRIGRRFGQEKESSPQWLVFRQELESVIDRGVRPVFISSQGDPRLEDLREAGGHTLRELCSRGKAELIIIPRSDHTFSSLHDQELLLKLVREKSSEIGRAGAKGRNLPSVPNARPAAELNTRQS